MSVFYGDGQCDHGPGWTNKQPTRNKKVLKFICGHYQDIYDN